MVLIGMRETVTRALVFASAAIVSLGLSTASAQSDMAFAPDVYAQRRMRLAEHLGPHPIVLLGADMTRRGDFDKQDPNFWYLTGIESPFAVLVVVPDGGEMREVLFLPDSLQFAGAQNPHGDSRFRRASWNRTIRRLAPGVVAEHAVGVDASHPLRELRNRLPDLIGAADTVFVMRRGGAGFAPRGFPSLVSESQQFEQALAELLPASTVADPTPRVERMRLTKDEHEIAALRQAAAISAKGFIEVLRTIEPGQNDRDVAGLMEYVWKREGSPRASFGPIVSSGAGSMSLFTLKSENYNSTDRVMQDGELVFIDYGAAEYRMYTSDICRTFPVNGRFSEVQRRYYNIVLEAQDSALAVIRPGVMMLDVIRAAARVFERHGLAQYEDIDRMGVDGVWGVMPSPTHYLIEGKGLTDYSGARGTGVRDLGHHIGLEVSESRDYSMPLEPGMVFTVEPKLYVPEENMAIMIEDMIVVTETGYENLSAGAPRRVEEIERLMAS